MPARVSCTGLAKAEQKDRLPPGMTHLTPHLRELARGGQLADLRQFNWQAIFFRRRHQPYLTIPIRPVDLGALRSFSEPVS